MQFIKSIEKANVFFLFVSLICFIHFDFQNWTLRKRLHCKVKKNICHYFPQYPMNVENKQLDLNNDNRWKSRNDVNYALYNLLRRWVCMNYYFLPFHHLILSLQLPFFCLEIQIDDSKKGSEELGQTSETDTIFKNTYVWRTWI